MAFTNLDSKEIHSKILYIGAKGAGKTSNLQAVYKNADESARESTFEMEVAPFFEFLPLKYAKWNQFQIRLHLYTLELSPLYRTVFGTLLNGVDAVVMVYDSRLGALQANLECWREAKMMFTHYGYNFTSIPKVIQFNKHDHKDALPMTLLQQELNPTSLASVPANALTGAGCMETLQLISQQLMLQLQEGVN